MIFNLNCGISSVLLAERFTYCLCYSVYMLSHYDEREINGHLGGEKPSIAGYLRNSNCIGGKLMGLNRGPMNYLLPQLLRKLYFRTVCWVNFTNFELLFSEPPGVQVNWVIFAFDHLIALHQSTGELKEAAVVEAQKEEWVANNPPHTSKITPQVLMEPPKPYAEFLSDFNIWQKRVDRWKEAKESWEKVVPF